MAYDHADARIAALAGGGAGLGIVAVLMLVVLALAVRGSVASPPHRTARRARIAFVLWAIAPAIIAALVDDLVMRRRGRR